jgi:hypothetical protein
VSSLQFLIKQAEATMDTLRTEREASARVRSAISIARNGAAEEKEERKAA